MTTTRPSIESLPFASDYSHPTPIQATLPDYSTSCLYWPGQHQPDYVIPFEPIPFDVSTQAASSTHPTTQGFP